MNEREIIINLIEYRFGKFKKLFSYEELDIFEIDEMLDALLHKDYKTLFKIRFKQDFSNKQVKELILGIKHQVNINKYAKSEFSPIKMRFIRKLLIHNININRYIHKNYNDKQIS